MFGQLYGVRTVFVISRCSVEMAGRIELRLDASFDLSYTVL